MAAARVLVVDDEPGFLYAITRTLSLGGYDVLAAGSPHQAREILEKQVSVDVVLSDIMLPDMCGPAFIRELAQVLPQAAYLLMTSSPLDSSGIPDGIPVLRKPIATPDLIAAVQNAICQSAELAAQFQQSKERSAEMRQQSRQLGSQCQELGRKSAETIRKSTEILGAFKPKR